MTVQNHKSPFILIENFLSPLECEDIIEKMNFDTPTLDKDGNPIMMHRNNKIVELRLTDRLDDILIGMESYYGFAALDTHPFEFQWYPAGYKPKTAKSENSTLVRNHWIRTNSNDFVGIIFLNDYQDKMPFDPNYEVVGGTLEFPTHDFKINPKRGMLVVFPGSPEFAFATGPVHLGDSHQIKITFEAEEPYKYDRNNFKGTYRDWFPA